MIKSCFLLLLQLSQCVWCFFSSDVWNGLHCTTLCNVQDFTASAEHCIVLPRQKKHFAAVYQTLDTAHCAQCNGKKQRTTAPQSAALLHYSLTTAVLHQTVQCSRLPPPAIDPPSKPKFLLLTLATTEERDKSNLVGKENNVLLLMIV